MTIKARTVFAAGLTAFVLSGCVTMTPASYANYADNTYALRKYEGAKVRIGSFNDLSHFDGGCRLGGPIKTAGDRPIPQFVQDSLNDELKFAGLYSDDQSAVNLAAALQTAKFSSVPGPTGGYWSFSLQLSNSANGKSLTANSQYSFDTGLEADTACRNVANALTPAVQRLINKAVTDPSFGSVIGK
jgi:hypothetical protein